jgi:hypothetical protein
MKPVHSALKISALLATGALLAACGSSATTSSSASPGTGAGSSTAASPGAAAGTATGSTDQASTGFPLTFSECGKSYTFTTAPKILVDTPQAAAVSRGGTWPGAVAYPARRAEDQGKPPPGEIAAGWRPRCG